MGWYDYITDITASLTIGSTYAEQSQSLPDGEDDNGSPNGSDSVKEGGMGNAQQRGAGATKGGASTSKAVGGSDEESSSEKEANDADEAKQVAKSADKEAPAGHKPGDGGEGSGQKGPQGAGPHGGPVKAAAEDDGEEEFVWGFELVP